MQDDARLNPTHCFLHDVLPQFTVYKVYIDQYKKGTVLKERPVSEMLKKNS
jgi:hypothetical protein